MPAGGEGQPSRARAGYAVLQAAADGHGGDAYDAYDDYSGEVAHAQDSAEDSMHGASSRWGSALSQPLNSTSCSSMASGVGNSTLSAADALAAVTGDAAAAAAAAGSLQGGGRAASAAKETAQNLQQQQQQDLVGSLAAGPTSIWSAKVKGPKYFLELVHTQDPQTQLQQHGCAGPMLFRVLLPKASCTSRHPVPADLEGDDQVRVQTKQSRACAKLQGLLLLPACKARHTRTHTGFCYGSLVGHTHTQTYTHAQRCL